MGWTLLSPGDAKPGALSFRLPDEGKVHLVTSVPSPKIGCVHELKDFQTELGRVTTGSWGAKIEATKPGLILVSAHANEHPSMLGAGFDLWPDTNSSATSFFLRHGDTLKSSNAPGSLVLTWTTSEVQVNSSAAEVEAENKQPERGDGVAETDEDETGDEEDLDATMTAIETSRRKSQQLRATPHLSNQASTVVQETPTADRVNGALDDTAVSEMRITPVRTRKVIPPSDVPTIETEQYSTARTGESQHNSEGHEENSRPDQSILGPKVKLPDNISHGASADDPEETPKKGRHPKVVVPSKRLSPPADSDAPGKKRSTKRTKKDTHQESNTQDSAVSSTPAKKSRSRLSEVKGSNEVDIPRTSRSPRSSQGTNAPAYEGPRPSVALSNSSILAGHQSVKFLKKQGGNLVESMKDMYNILCIRDGSLHKTAKVLRAIAMGIPIVTDKWLLDSAKVGHFLSVEDYKPSVPEQEKEWNFSLENVLGQPQKPFEGYKVHFTTKLQSDYSAFAEIEQVCMAAGAKKVTTKKMDKTGAIIVLASDKGDDEAEAMMQEDVVCYQRDLLPLTIFRGSLDLDSDEFRLKAGGTTNSSNKDTTKRRGRKS